MTTIYQDRKYGLENGERPAESLYDSEFEIDPELGVNIW